MSQQLEIEELSLRGSLLETRESESERESFSFSSYFWPPNQQNQVVEEHLINAG